MLNKIAKNLHTTGNLKFLIITLSACLVIFLRCYNLFVYPFYGEDEGTYLSQAWAVTELNKLAPYTYWYDHSPFGWIFLGGIIKAIGGYNSFGNGINTGRFAILLCNLITCLIVYLIISKITKNYIYSILSVLFFTVLPLANYYQRGIYLDNIMITFFALSVYFIVDDKIKVKNVILSGVLFGLCILAKESAVIFFPGMLYLLYSGLKEKQRVLMATLWFFLVSSIIGLYVTLAILKTELFPSLDKVSLIYALKFQLTRTSGLYFWEKNSEFMEKFNTWNVQDNISILLLLVLTLISFIYTLTNLKNRIAVSFGLFNLFYILYLLRGGVVLNIYIIPLIFTLSLAFGIILTNVNDIKIVNYQFKRLIYSILILICVTSISFSSSATFSKFNNNEVLDNDKATQWVRNNVDNNATIVIDCSYYPMFHFPPNGTKIFKNAEWYSKVSFDPEIKTLKFKDNPENVDYIISTYQYESGIFDGKQPFTKEIYVESKDVKFAESNSAKIMKVIKDKPKILKNTWNSMKINFLNDGRIIEKNNSQINSYRQANAMILSLLNDDKETFDSIWNWTKNNLQRFEDKLFYSEFLNGKVSNPQTNSEAESNIALSLYMASKKWKDPILLEESKLIINDLWNTRVATLNENKVILKNSSNKLLGYEIIDPSVISPSHYRIFQKINPLQEWDKLADSSYEVLTSILNVRKLIPNSIKFNYLDNSWSDENNTNETSKMESGIETSKLYWKLNLDNKITNQTIKNLKLTLLSEFYETEYLKEKNIASIFNQSGKALDVTQTTSTNSGVYNLFEFTNSKSKDFFWRDKFIENIDLESLIFDQNGSFDNQFLGLIAISNRKNIISDLLK